MYVKQIKTTMRYHLTSVRMTIIKKIYKQVLERVWEKRETFDVVGRNVSWHSHYGEQYEGSLEN